MFTFDPDRVAYAEAHGWRAYYDHDWPKMLRLIVEMSQAQFRIPFPLSLVSAFYITRASAAWAPVDHDESVVRANLMKYYRVARRYSGLSFEVERAAQAEFHYWDVHRRLSGKPDKTEFVDAMITLHSLIFGLTPEQARESAELRVLANTSVDLITSKTSTDPEADWRLLEDYLQRCYRSIAQELGRARVTAD